MPNPATVDQLFLGRQPILDAGGTLIGYELLFRTSAENRAIGVAPGIATADVVCKAFADLGLAKALSGHKAFVIADAEFLKHEAVEVLPADSVVFEIDAHLLTDATLNARCQTLGELGFEFCLSNPAVLDETTTDMLKRAHFVKFNIDSCNPALLKQMLSLPPELRPIVIACRVETPADRQRAEELGFHFFQGYYFAQPTLVEARKADPAVSSLIRIVGMLNRDADDAEVEQQFKGEVSLTMKLLRLTNSVGIGLRVRISSVRQAITVVGRRHIQRWLQLLLFSYGGSKGDVATNPLMQYAALKGSFMERLARSGFPQQSGLADMAFLAGLLSLLPAALGMSMEEILEQLAVAPQLGQALIQGQGELGLLLKLTDAYDKDDPANVDTLLEALDGRIQRDTLNQCLAESIAWVQTLSQEAG